MKNNEYKELYIIGAGGFGREVLDTIHEINEIKYTYAIKGFIDENSEQFGKMINDFQVFGNIEYLVELSEKTGMQPYAVIAIADPLSKERIAKILAGKVRWENIIHPSVVVKKSSFIGEGVIIQQFSSISSNVEIGEHCIINCNCIIGHDSQIGDYSSIMPQVGIMGKCVVGVRSYFGVGAKVLPGVSIGKDTIIGAGAIVIRDVDEKVTVVGNPAKRIR